MSNNQQTKYLATELGALVELFLKIIRRLFPLFWLVFPGPDLDLFLPNIWPGFPLPLFPVFFPPTLLLAPRLRADLEKPKLKLK